MFLKPSLVLSFLSIVSFAANSNNKSNQDFPESDSFRIPLYEQYKITGNCHFNQLVMEPIRWTTIGTLAGATIGGIMDMGGGDIFIPSTVVLGGIGMGAGFLTGVVVGSITGVTHQRRKMANPGYHDPRCRLGYEVLMLSRSFLSNRAIARYEDQSVLGTPDISIVFRPLARNSFVPEKITFSYYHEWWGRHADYSVTHYGRLFCKRIEGGIRYDFINLKTIVPYWSAGFGYSWGKEIQKKNEFYYDPISGKNESKPLERNEYSIVSPVLRGYLGGEVNLFDFCYVDLKMGYEAVGPYLFLHHKEYFPYSQNWVICFSVGTYTF